MQTSEQAISLLWWKKKKLDAEKYGWPLIRQCMYHNAGVHIKDAYLFGKSTCLRCPALNGVWTR